MPDPVSYGHYGQRTAGFATSDSDPHGCFFLLFPPPPTPTHPRHRKWPGSSLLDPNRIRFCTSGPVPISMRYPGSAWTERSQIRAASGATDRDHIRRLCSGPDGHRPIRIGSVFLQLTRFQYRCFILRNMSNVKQVVCFGIVSFC